MIFGIGTDLCEISRMEKSLESPAFMRRVFSPEEQALLAGCSPRRRAESAAANFAAKEAFLKATGRGLGGFAMAEIAALRQESGQPYFVLSGAAAAYAAEHHLTAHLSLSHDGGMASAFVVLETLPPQTEKQ